MGVEGSSKSICVRRFSPSPISLFRFHFFPFPQKRLILRLRTVRQETTTARAGTLPDFLYEKDIVPGESVDLTGDVGLPDEYDTSSSAEEEETEDQVGEGSVRVATLDGEANFLLGRVSAFGRAVRFNNRFMFP